jgi:ABC-type nitrate/sulfonate/bicarbonate transport system substrate-binding protein
MVRADFARSRATEHVALVAALIEAAAFCDCPENRERVAETLAQRHYLNVPVGVVRASLCGPFDRGQDRLEDADSFHIFHRQNANVPDATKAQWVFGHLKQLGLVHGALPPLFRADIYQQAIQLHKELHEPEFSNLAARDVVAA